MRFRVFFEGALCLGAALAIVGGAAIGILEIVAPEIEILRRVEAGYRHIIFGFLFLTLFAVAAALLDALAASAQTPGAAAAPDRPAALPTEAQRAAGAKAGSAAAASRLAALYHEMKTYVDLEMWELALEKANAIVKDFPGTREAELVTKNLNELRWKAEPKFVAKREPMSADQEKQLREKGLAQMFQHVRTYMDLEMWELARQKAVAIMKNFPDSPEAVELLKDFETIEKKAREAVGAEKTEG